MNEQQFGNRVRQILKQRAELSPQVAERLRAARERALARQRREPQTALEWAHQAIGGLGGWSGVSLKLVAPLAALAIGLSLIYVWQQNQRVAEMEEIDAQLLTDDLPIDAYLDRGFQNFIKTRAGSE
jgi:hypothetical protein